MIGVNKLIIDNVNNFKKIEFAEKIKNSLNNEWFSRKIIENFQT